MSSFAPHETAVVGAPPSPPAVVGRAHLVAVADHGADALAVVGRLRRTGALVTRVQLRELSGRRAALRIELDAPDLERGAVADAIPEGVAWGIGYAAAPPRIAVLVSREGHCALDLLDRPQDELGGRIGLVLSNHELLRDEVERRGVPFAHVPVTPERRTVAEREQLALLAGHCDVVVLARYMQILSPGFLEQVGVPVINVHHSLLPAFPGGGPYERAYARGVKLIGATAHYATDELDAGPIIEQDVARVADDDGPAQLRRTGADVERRVLARAVRWHCEGRVVRDGSRTVLL